ncbi:hypothetical protein Y032_0331g2730 [Ancylostoma ceylanicum]|nr:hypothetical protein Y032_0331g2730 [Ancylostoma ceylanicum]
MGRHRHDKKRKSQSMFAKREADNEFEKHLRYSQSNASLKLYSEKSAAKNDESSISSTAIVPASLLTQLNKAKSTRDFGLVKSSSSGLTPRNGIKGEIADENGQLQDSHEHLRELSARALNGMSALDFRDRMLCGSNVLVSSFSSYI